ncbi:MAG: 50S ribosomal protein L31e [Nanoarchaeota archaeon]
MAKIERVYNVPLRKEWLKVPLYQRAEKAVRALRQFTIRHMKSEDVCIGPHANMELWKHGMRNPPHHIKINAVKEDDGKVVIELFGKPMPSTKKEKPMEKGAVKKAVEALTGMKVKDKKPEPKTAEVVSEKPAEKKEEKPKAAPKSAAPKKEHKANE